MNIRTFLLLFTMILNGGIGITQEKFGKFKIHGVIHDFDQESKYNTISVVLFDLFNEQKTETIVVDNSGEFRFQHSLPCTKDVILMYGKSRTYMLCSPGDSINLNIIDTTFFESNTNESNSVKFIFSNCEIGKTNKLVNQFIKESGAMHSLDEIMAKLSPDEFIE